MAAAAALRANCWLNPSSPSRLSRPAGHSKTRTRARARRGTARQQPAARMHVPRDIFKGLSAEARAAQNLVGICTVVAIRVVLAQLGPGGEGGDLPPTPQFEFLSGYLSTHPLAGGQHPDEWLEGLMAQPEHGQLLGVRILEVREAFCLEDLDWKQMRQLTGQAIRQANVQLLRRHAARAFGGSLSGGGSGSQEGDTQD